MDKSNDLHESIPSLQDGDSIITDSKEKAELFNDYFASASSIDSTHATLPDAQPVIADQPTLDYIVITQQEVADQIATLNCNKVYGPDNISPYFLKYGGTKIAYSLTYIFNLSLQKCTYPSAWKQANVTLIHKKDDKSVVRNFRPISLLSVASKLIEWNIIKHMYNFSKTILYIPHINQVSIMECQL